MITQQAPAPPAERTRPSTKWSALTRARAAEAQQAAAARAALARDLTERCTRLIDFGNLDIYRRLVLRVQADADDFARKARRLTEVHQAALIEEQCWPWMAAA
jgi:hypothetical protein